MNVEVHFIDKTRGNILVPNSVSFSECYVWYLQLTFSVRRQTCNATSSPSMKSCAVHKVQICIASLNCINKKEDSSFCYEYDK